MPKQWKQYSGIWTSTQQAQALAAGTWTGIIQYITYGAGQNFFGALGIGDASSKTAITETLIPISSTQANEVKTNTLHSGVITGDGKLYLMGYNAYGSLGQNDTIGRSSPTQVGALTTWAHLAISSTSTSAVKTDGTLWTWGKGATYGALGQNSVINYSSPVQVGASTDWARVYGGSDSVLAIKTNGTLWGWGYGNKGRLGNNSTINKSSPVQIGALTNWAEIGWTGGITANVWARKTDGTLWGWGANGFGTLGVGDYVYKSSPVQVGALTTWYSVSSGDNFSIATRTDGTLWVVGRSDDGVYGDNTAGIYAPASPIQSGSGTDWTIVRAGTSVSALKDDGSLWSWGYNDFGQQGLGDTISRSSPVQVGAGSEWLSVSVSNRSMFAIEKNIT
jgi:alpha-tubulin suppressor-like RCC1 family protein